MIIEEGDIWGKMKQHEKYNENTYGQKPANGSINTSRGVPPANKTKI